MHKRVLIAACALLGIVHVGAQDAQSVIDAASRAMGTASLQSVHYLGMGTNNSVGQAQTPGGPWPQFKVTRYDAFVNYASPAMRQEVIRIDNERPPRGGGAGPFNPATGQGGIRPIPGNIVQNQTMDGGTEVGALNIWLTAHGFLKGAAANVGTAKVSVARGKRIVSFTAFGKYSVAGTIGGQNFVEKVETRIDNNVTGDTLIEVIYSDYFDFRGVMFPSRIVQRQGGHPVLDIEVAAVDPNSPAALEIRGGAPGAGRSGSPGPVGGPSAAPVEKIGDGVWFLTLGNPQSILVEFGDHVVIIEAPTNDDRTLATIAEVKKMFPAKAIKYVVNTHHHFDHAGGLRAYVAEGIPILTHATHKRYYEQEIFKSPHTLNPDRLARAPRAPIIETVDDKRILTDGRMSLELHLVRGNLHSDGLLMAYIPREKLLIQADTFAPRPGAPPLPSPSPYTANLLDNIKRLKLDVARIAHVHGGVDSFATVEQASR